MIGDPVLWNDVTKPIREKIVSIEAPDAIKPLAALLEKEKDHNIKKMYVEALGSIAVAISTAKDAKPRRDVLEILVTISVEEEEVLRDEAIRQLSKLSYLRDAIPQYAAYLRSKWVTRAANALSETKLTKRKKYQKPDKRLVYPLIDALVVTRPKKIPVDGSASSSLTLGTSISLLGGSGGGGGQNNIRVRRGLDRLKRTRKRKRQQVAALQRKHFKERTTKPRAGRGPLGAQGRRMQDAGYRMQKPPDARA